MAPNVPPTHQRTNQSTNQPSLPTSQAPVHLDFQLPYGHPVPDLTLFGFALGWHLAECYGCRESGNLVSAHQCSAANPLTPLQVPQSKCAHAPRLAELLLDWEIFEDQHDDCNKSVGNSDWPYELKMVGASALMHFVLYEEQWELQRHMSLERSKSRLFATSNDHPTRLCVQSVYVYMSIYILYSNAYIHIYIHIHTYGSILWISNPNFAPTWGMETLGFWNMFGSRGSLGSNNLSRPLQEASWDRF